MFVEAHLLKSAQNEKFHEEYNSVIYFYTDNFEANEVEHVLLGIATTNIPCESANHLHSITPYLHELSPSQRSLMSVVCILAT